MARDGFITDLQPSLKKKTSWILLDCTGEGTILDIDKYTIMNRVEIHARDFRIIDPLLSYPSAILGRERAIVLNLEHIKAIITAEEVFLRDPLEDNVIPIIEELRRRLPPAYTIPQPLRKGREHSSGEPDIEASEDESPFEFRALEVALEAICSFLDARTTELETATYPALDELTSNISRRNLDRVRKLKTAMTKLTARVQKVRDELDQLLEDDDDMADLYLSRKLVGVSSRISGSGLLNSFPDSSTIGTRISKPSKASVALPTVHGHEDDVEELEMLLEAYFIQIDGTLNKLTTLSEYIDDTENYINIQLDNHRNRLIQLNLFLTAGNVCLSIYDFVTSLLAMNVPYNWNNNHGYMFKWVVIVTGLMCASIYVLIVSYARYKGLIGSSYLHRR
ncbi:magnesium transporter MRS2-I-like [Tasmannia lanceolata]|uniref:magnesium transporter MRS2-I-like n=1 Tax=Tasmannia lanceolata TaxID=3420 RepID=UPI0040636BA9